MMIVSAERQKILDDFRIRKIDKQEKEEILRDGDPYEEEYIDTIVEAFKKYDWYSPVTGNFYSKEYLLTTDLMTLRNSMKYTARKELFNYKKLTRMNATLFDTYDEIRKLKNEIAGQTTKSFALGVAVGFGFAALVGLAIAWILIIF